MFIVRSRPVFFYTSQILKFLLELLRRTSQLCVSFWTTVRLARRVWMGLSHPDIIDVIQSILCKAQRDQQVLQNIAASNKEGSTFISSMEKAKKFSAGVIFKNGKCLLDEDVLTLALNAKEKKENQFKERIGKLHKQYNDRKKSYIAARKNFDESKDTKDKLPLKLLKPLVVWKKRKGDEVIPSKHDALIERWSKTKHRADLSFEEALKETSIFATYKKETG